MQKHTKIYMKHFGYYSDEYIPCECCGSVAVDVHHIHGRKLKSSNNIENLIGLCRNCHNRAHFKTRPYWQKEALDEIHALFLEKNMYNDTDG